MRIFKYLKAKKIYNADVLRARYVDKLLKTHDRELPQPIPDTIDSPSTRGVTSEDD